MSTPHINSAAIETRREELPRLPRPGEENTLPNNGTFTSPPGVSGDAAHRYARMSAPECMAELSNRNVKVQTVSATRGVRIPVRLDGTIAGVRYRSMSPPRKGEASQYEIFDCRLVLAVEDMSRDLYTGGVRDVVYFSAYRPPAKNDPLTEGAGKRHFGALAIDLASFLLADGTKFDVDRDFDGALGDPPCEWKKPFRAHAAFVLHDIACRAHAHGLFHVMLTPNFNHEHHNHFHFEITERVGWYYLR